MTKKTTYIKPHIKVYFAHTTKMLADSNQKSVSVGGDDTDIQLSKRRSSLYDVVE